MGTGVTVGSLLAVRGAAGLDLEVLAGASGLERRITLPYIQKTGLALAGFDEYLHPGRVLIFGESEVRYLEHLAPKARTEALRRLCQRDLPCVMITMGLETPPELAIEAESRGVPVLRTPVSTPMAIARLTAHLEDELAPRDFVHGVLLDVLGLGVLIMGDSGIGKSECALDLIVRGHRLVADDVVELRCRAGSSLMGACPEPTRYHLEIRGLGLINVTDLFGVSATQSSKRVELVVRLERWETGREYDRLGLDTASEVLLGAQVPLVRMPVAPGRNIATLIEVAARNQVLRMRGRNAAQILTDRLERRLAALADRGDAEGEDV